MATTIPDTIDRVTPRWLSGAVAARYPGEVADAVEVLDAHSGTTGRARIRVRWRSDVGAPETLFVKLAPTDPAQREWVVAVGMGRHEARFYADLAGDLPIRLPATVWAGSNEDGSAYLMLLEDLVAAGCQPYAWGVETHDVLAHAEAMMETLGALHGHFWESPRFAADLDWVRPPGRSEVGPALMREAVAQFGAQMPDAFGDLADLYIHHTDAVNDFLEEGPSSLAHGDCHLGNTFGDGSTVGLLDWALVCRASAFRDVSYYLCNSLPSEVRREHARALVLRYLGALAAAGGEARDIDGACVAIGHHAVTSWVAATVTAATGSRMQRLEAGMLGMQRSTDALVEYDTAHALRRALGR